MTGNASAKEEPHQNHIATHPLNPFFKNPPNHKPQPPSPLPNIHLHPLLIITHIRIPPLRLRYQPPRHPRAQHTAPAKQPQHVLEPQDLRPAQVVEQQRREDGAEFPGRGADAVGEAADARREGFGGDDEGGGVGAEVEEELGGVRWVGKGMGMVGGGYLEEGEEDEFAGGVDVVVAAGEDGE